ncbi:helix-turn-helix transcriptional regulator [Streptomyces sp. NPDC015242]|uniref:helix-turn-helix transcriptional regulator n=1 Tax=Streptomyces sp. NPDC015242 TaxID=3364951 RepID=UPI0037022ED3
MPAPQRLEGLAAGGVPESTAFAARFRTYVGRAPAAYLTWWRLSTAARLLRETAAPLAAVARPVGYGSESAFANACKREFGTAPGSFRRAHTAAAPEPRRPGEETG